MQICYQVMCRKKILLFLFLCFDISTLHNLLPYDTILMCYLLIQELNKSINAAVQFFAQVPKSMESFLKYTNKVQSRHKILRYSNQKGNNRNLFLKLKCNVLKYSYLIMKCRAMLSRVAHFIFFWCQVMERGIQ